MNEKFEETFEKVLATFLNARIFSNDHFFRNAPTFENENLLTCHRYPYQGVFMAKNGSLKFTQWRVVRIFLFV